MLDNIPLELRERRQWCVWKYEQRETSAKPTKPPYHPNGYKISSVDPNTWATFDECVSALQTGMWNGLGFVLSSDDPYAFIDLDTYDPALSPEERERHKRIFDAFIGYAELSPSGQGCHLIVKASVAEGARRHGVEVYSAERYMTMTGNVIRAADIVDQQALVDILWAELKGSAAGDDADDFVLPLSQPEVIDDWTLCDRAAGAVNGAKFKHLWSGQWQTDYKSQSEADFALIDIIAFYTDNYQQVARVFRQSALGQRDKAKRDNFIMPMVKRAFDNKPPQIDLTKLRENMVGILAKAKADGTAAGPSHPDSSSPPTVAPAAPANEVYNVPAGLLGELAQYVYSMSPRPVPEISLVAAIGLMAGICGRAYNINGTGLNHYLLLITSTGNGKEAIALGISKVMDAVQKMVPVANDFVGPGDIRSGVALLKYIAKKSQSFVSVGGEFGHTLAQMASQNAASAVKDTKRVMLDLYGKSGAGSVLRPTIYSDVEKNTIAIPSPAFSFIGESAPQSFYESVDETLISDGLLPRFTLIEYNGIRTDLNPNSGHAPSEQLVQKVATICAHAMSLNKANKVIDVLMTPEAFDAMNAFDLDCTSKINDQASSEAIKHIWNRAHLRALKLAGVIAVGLNPYTPVVDKAAALWAIRLSSHNTQMLLSRFERGDVGAASTDDKQVRSVARVVVDYFSESWEKSSKYTNDQALWKAKLIPKHYIARRLAATSAFKNDRRGSGIALNVAIKQLIESGDLVEANKNDVFKLHQSTTYCLFIPNGKAFERLTLLNAQ